MKGLRHMKIRPAGFSDDDSEEDDDGWQNIKALKATRAQKKYLPNPQIQFEAAIKEGNLEGVKAALKSGVTIHTTDSGGYTGLMLACSFGHPHIVQYLVDEHSQVNACTSKLIYPLMVVCFSTCVDESRLLECAKILIKEYANVNTIDVHGTTALMYACKSGRCFLVDELVKNGANIETLDTQKWNALHHSANVGNVGAINVLLAAGAKKRVKDAMGRRPFEIAMFKPNMKDVAEALCPKGLRHLLESEMQEREFLEFQCEETAFQSFMRKMDAVTTNLNRPRPTKRGEKLNLFEFLTTTDEELQALGVERSWHRRQTLEYIKGFVLKPWERLVQPRLSNFGQLIANWNAEHGVAYKSAYPKLTYINSAHLVLGVATRLQIIQASARHLEMNLDLEEVDEKIQQQFKLAALNVLQFEKELRKLMRSLESHDKEPIIPADLIVSKPDEARKRGCWKVTVVGALSVLAFATWKFKGIAFLTT